MGRPRGNTGPEAGAEVRRAAKLRAASNNGLAS
jgi:hypothetical protein